MERIVIIGTSCAGKTTLAKRLVAIRQQPHIELDALYWDRDWQAVPRNVFRERATQAVTQDRWVLDGNYQSVRDIVWPCATTFIWLDYSFPRIFARALRRTFRRAISREQLWAGNRETLAKALLSRDSILLWVITTYWERRRTFPQALAQQRHAEVLRFRSPAATELWLQSLDK